MGKQRIQVGQVWKQEDTGENYLVTKIYTEALATVAVLRKAGDESSPRIRVKVSVQGGLQRLPGFSHTQQADDF